MLVTALSASFSLTALAAENSTEGRAITKPYCMYRDLYDETFIMHLPAQFVGKCIFCKL